MTTIYFYYYFSSIPFVANHVVLCPFKEILLCIAVLYLDQIQLYFKTRRLAHLQIISLYKLQNKKCACPAIRATIFIPSCMYFNSFLSCQTIRCSILFRQYDIRICNNWKVHNNLTYEQQQQQPFKHNQHRWSHLNRLYASHPKQFYSYLG